MKNIFKKFLITSLSTICLLTAEQTHAMEEENKGLSLSSFGNFSLQTSQLQQSVISDITQLTESQLLSLSQLISNVRQGGDTSGGLSGSSLQLSPEEREIKRLISKSADADLFPPLDPLQIMHLINEILVPKYAAVLSDRFAKRSLDISEGDFDDVLEFLTKNKPFIMGDLCSERAMILFLKLITQKPDFNINAHNPHYMHGHYNYPLTQQISWADCLEVKNGQFFIKIDYFYNHLKSAVSNQYYYHPGMAGDQQQQNEKNLVIFKGNFNKIFSYPGHEFDAGIDAAEVSKTIENWVNVVHKLVSFELSEWESKYTLLHQLQGSYDLTHKQLSEAQSNQGLYFSGVVKTPYTIGLIQVEKQEQASSPEFLKKIVANHHKTDEKKLNDYNAIKDELSSLRKLKNWFDTFLNEVSKKGRMS